MRSVVKKLAKNFPVWTIRHGKTWAGRVSRRIVPETEVTRAHRVIMSHSVFRVSDPETGWRLINVQQTRTWQSVHDQIVLDDVVDFNTVFDENGLTHDSVNHIVFNG